MVVRPDHENQDHRPDLNTSPRAEARGEVVEHRAEEEDGKVQRGKVVVEEQLALHEEEREEVEAPRDDEEAADLVVERRLG